MRAFSAALSTSAIVAFALDAAALATAALGTIALIADADAAAALALVTGALAAATLAAASSLVADTDAATGLATLADVSHANRASLAQPLNPFALAASASADGTAVSDRAAQLAISRTLSTLAFAASTLPRQPRGTRLFPRRR